MSDVATALEERLRPLARARNLASWDANIEATDENQRRRAEADLALSNVLAEADTFAEIQAARTGEADPLLRRRLDLLHDLMLPRQVPKDLLERIVELEASVAVRFSRHRGVVGGEEVDDIAIRKILRESDDSDERREAWEASKTVGAEVADDVRELARLRNEAARGLGYRDWFALALATSEMGEERLLETLSAADRATAEMFSRWKATLDERLGDRFGCAVSALRPWHYADPFFQEAPPEGSVDLDPYFRGRDLVGLARRTFEGLDFDVQDVLERSDLFPRDGKNQHAFCTDIDREGDVRILGNVTDNHDSMEMLLHELGHAVYDLCFDQGLDWLLRSAHLVPTEASAILFDGLAADRSWFEHVLGLEGGEARRLENELRVARGARMLVFTRWVLVMTGFERELYRDPEGDLHAIWWELVHRYQLVTPPEERHAADWAAKLHIALAPVYYHTYLYGSIVAAQIREFLDTQAGGIVDVPGAGKLLAERLYAPGRSIRWDHLVERTTGGPLSVDVLQREIAPAAA